MVAMDEIIKSNDQIEFNDELKGHLLIIAKWAKFLSIMGFIGVGFMLLLAFIMLIMRTSLGFLSVPRVGTGIIAIVYVLFAFLYFFPVFLLFMSSVKITKGIKSNNQELLTSGFEFLKIQYKYKGIAIIIGLASYIVVIISTITIAALKSPF